MKENGPKMLSLGVQRGNSLSSGPGPALDVQKQEKNIRKSKPYAKIPLHWSKIYFLTNSRVLISNMAILLQNCRPKTRNRGFLVLDLRFVFFWNITFCSNKFEGDFYQMLVLKYPNEAFLVPNLSIFILIQNFAS